MSDGIRWLRNRYPCCGDRCRYELEAGEARQVVCPRCGRPWLAVPIESGAYAQQMAGQRVGTVRFEPVEVRA